MAEPSGRSKNAPLPIRLLGWIFGTLSVLNLIRDTTPVELYGQLRVWIDAYASFVGNIGHALFGWINWSWINIDSAELHVIMLSVILGGTWGRAAYASGIARGAKDDAIANLIAVPLTAILIFFLLVLLIPSPWGARIGFGSEAFIFLAGAITDDDELSRASDFRRELVIVLAGFVLILFANYMIFRPG